MVRNRQNPNRIRDKAPKRPAMRAAVSIKNPSGTMLMSISVAGSRIHRSLVKNIWWNMTKYLEKSVEIIRARAVISPKNRPHPIHRDEGRVCLIRPLAAAIKISNKAAAARQIRRMAVSYTHLDVYKRQVSESSGRMNATQWSVVFNCTDLTAKIITGRQYDKPAHEFSLDQ